jgi:predicted small lipoprotein YifL
MKVKAMATPVLIMLQQVLVTTGQGRKGALKMQRQTKKYIPLLVFIIAMALVAAGCGNQGTSFTPPQSDKQATGHYFDLVYENAAYNLSFSYPDQWTVTSESESNGVLTLKLNKAGNNSVSLVISVLPGEMPVTELVKNGEKFLTGSLYKARVPSATENKVLSGRPVTFLTAEAGERDSIKAKSALFSENGNSYFFTLLAQSVEFPVANETFELIVSGIQ